MSRCNSGPTRRTDSSVRVYDDTPALGIPTVAPRHPGGALVTDVASAGRGLSRRRIDQVLGGAPAKRALLRAGGPIAKGVRRHAGCRDRRRQRHRPATAMAFAGQGAQVVVSDIDGAAAAETAAAITDAGAGPSLCGRRGRRRRRRALRGPGSSAIHGFPDIVVNNAGIRIAGPFLDTPADQFDRVLDVNLGGVVNCRRAFARRLVARGPAGMSSTSRRWRPTPR